MVDPQLRDILDHDDALMGGCAREERGEQRRLPAAGRPGDEDVRAARDQTTRPVGIAGREEPADLEILERRSRGGGHPDRERGAAARHRGEHGVHADAVAEPHIHARGRLIDVPPARRDEAHREFASTTRGQGERALAHRTVAAVRPDGAVGVDEDVGHGRIADEGDQRPERGGNRSRGSRPVRRLGDEGHRPRLPPAGLW